jgi:translation initiation factor 1 (eIF-1/SUI1)
MGKAELNLDKLRSRTVGTISTEEALSTVQEMKWPDEVMNGQKKVVITKVEKAVERRCVKLVIRFINESDFDLKMITDNLN